MCSAPGYSRVSSRIGPFIEAWIRGIAVGLADRWTKDELDAASDALRLFALAESNDEKEVRTYLLNLSPDRTRDLCVALVSIGAGFAETFASEAGISFSQALETMSLEVSDTDES